MNRSSITIARPASVPERAEQVERGVASFDLFDTLIVRRTGLPKEIFRRVGRLANKRGLIDISPSRFLSARVAAEQMSRVDRVDGECSIADIYETLEQLLGIEHARARALSQLELDVERQQLVACPTGIEKLEQARVDGKSIVFLSDMYLPADFLRSVLTNLGLWRDGDRLWVSNEHDASKHSGRLFRRMTEAIQTPASLCSHTGNDRNADVKMARSAGITPVFTPEGNLLAFETRLAKLSEVSDGLASDLAGASRLFRLQSTKPPGPKFSVVAGVIVPMLYSYACWIVLRAKQQGLKKLYFVSRDGYLPMLTASRIVAALGLDLECRYLYGSRQAWHLAGLDDWNEHTREWFLGGMEGETFGTVLKRIDVDWDEWTNHLAADEEWPSGDSELTPELRQRIWDAVTGKGTAAEVVRERAAAAKSKLLAYLEQEAVLGNEPIGMVELGWSGRTRRSFENAIGPEQAERLRWFYLGIKTRVQVDAAERVETFLFGPRMRDTVIPNLPVLAESFCLAPHGSVRSYQFGVGGTITPVFKSKAEKAIDQWGRDDVLSMLEGILDSVQPEEHHLTGSYNLRGFARQLMHRFSTKPTREEAAAWGDFPFEHDQAGDTSTSLAAPARFTLAGATSGLTYGSLRRAATGGVLGAWGQACWARRKVSAWLLVPFVLIGIVRVQGIRNVARKSLSTFRGVLRCVHQASASV